MDELLSTRQVAWVLDRSPASIRDGIKDGDIDGVRIPGGFRVPKAEVLRLARERVEEETGRTVPDSRLERLIDEVIARNERTTQS